MLLFVLKIITLLRKSIFFNHIFFIYTKNNVGMNRQNDTLVRFYQKIMSLKIYKYKNVFIQKWIQMLSIVDSTIMNFDFYFKITTIEKNTILSYRADPYAGGGVRAPQKLEDFAFLKMNWCNLMNTFSEIFMV